MRRAGRPFSASFVALLTIFAVVGLPEVAGAAVRVPTAPVPAVAVPFGNNVAKVTWRKPAARGSRILGYTVRPYHGKVALPPLQYDAKKTTRIVTGLINGLSYHFTVEARNAIGTSAPAAAAPMTVGAPLTPHAPSVPTSVAPNQLQVVFKAPNNGGAPITSYSVSCAVDIFKHVTATGPPVPFKGGFVIYVKGLKTGKSYSCRVKATNSRGSGPLSAQSPRTVVT